MKKIIIILLYAFGSLGCSQQQQNGCLDEEFLVKLGERPYNSNIYLVIPVHSGDSVHDALLSISRLYHESYEAGFNNYLSFQEFLQRIYNQKISISAYEITPEYYYNSLKESVIENEYREHGLSWILEKYFETTENESYRLSNDLAENEIYYIIRIFFNHHFFISLDCYEGFYYFWQL